MRRRWGVARISVMMGRQTSVWNACHSRCFAYSLQRGRPISALEQYDLYRRTAKGSRPRRGPDLMVPINSMLALARIYDARGDKEAYRDYVVLRACRCRVSTAGARGEESEPRAQSERARYSVKRDWCADRCCALR